MLKIKLPNYINKIIDILNKAGFECFVVGGYLRDLLLNKQSKDIDLTTSATPQEMIDVFSDFHILPTGLKHGTITIIIDDKQVEITTFRTDGKYEDHRKPNEVYFTKSIEQDLARRDFTINALAYNEQRGLVDPWNGKTDIENKIIRTVGNAYQRFNEDALRILRGLRLSSELSYNIEENTAKAMIDCKHLLQYISKERIQSELNRILLGENVFDVLINFYEILFEIIPELNNSEQYKNNFNLTSINQIFLTLSYTKNKIQNRLASLLFILKDPISILKRLKYDNNTINKVEKIISIQYENLVAEKRNIWKLVTKYGHDLFLDGLDIYINRSTTMSLINASSILDIMTKLAFDSKFLTLKDLAINGNDLIELGYQGKEIGNILNKLLEKVCVDDLNNTKEVLLTNIKKGN